MNRKKVLSVMLATALCLTMATAAFAEAPSVGDPTTPSIGDPVLPETKEPVAPDTGRTPSVGDIRLQTGINLSSAIPVGEDTAHVEVYGNGAQMTPDRKSVV